MKTFQKWNKVKLGDTLDFYNGKAIKKSEYGERYPVYGANGKIGLSDKFLYEDSIIVGRVGVYCGSIQYEKGKFWPSDNTIVVKTQKEKGLNNFMYYALKNKNLNNYAGGAAQPLVTQTVLKQIEIEIPDLQTQKQIADVLSAYDDLIENNNRRIKILEETAQKIYKEWFVNFRFPGYEKVKMVAGGGDFGMIPEGWEVKRLIDVANITMGQSPASDSYNSEGIGTVFHQGVTNFGVRFPEDVLFSVKGNKVAKEGDILFSVRAPVGRINIANQKTILGRGVSGIKSKKDKDSFLLYLLKKEFEIEDKIGSGSIFQSVTKTDLENYAVLNPTQDLIAKFESFARDLDLLIKNLSINTKGLKKTRDILIPQLVSGKLEVK